MNCGWNTRGRESFWWILWLVIIHSNDFLTYWRLTSYLLIAEMNVDKARYRALSPRANENSLISSRVKRDKKKLTASCRCDKCTKKGTLHFSFPLLIFFFHSYLEQIRMLLVNKNCKNSFWSCRLRSRVEIMYQWLIRMGKKMICYAFMIFWFCSLWSTFTVFRFYFLPSSELRFNCIHR